MRLRGKVYSTLEAQPNAKKRLRNGRDFESRCGASIKLFWLE